MLFLLLFNTCLVAVGAASHSSDGPTNLSKSPRIQLIPDTQIPSNVTQDLGNISSEAVSKFVDNSTSELLRCESDCDLNSQELLDSTKTSQKSESEEESVEAIAAETALKDSKLYASHEESDSTSALSRLTKISDENNLRITPIRADSSQEENGPQISNSIHKSAENNNGDFESSGALRNSKPKRKRKKSSRKSRKRKSSGGIVMPRPEVAILPGDPLMELEADYVETVAQLEDQYGITEILPDAKYHLFHYSAGIPQRAAQLLVYDKRAWVFPQQNITLNFTYPPQARRQAPDFQRFFITQVFLAVTHQANQSRLFLIEGGLMQPSLQLSVVAEEISLISFKLSIFGIPVMREVYEYDP